MDNLLIATVGLPRSGKTTLCRLVSDRKGWPIISPDAFRVAIHGKRYDQDRELEVCDAMRVTINALFLAGTSRVIVDACNVHRICRDSWRCNPGIVKYDVAFHDMNVSVDVCLKRASWDGDDEILPHISDMAAQFEPIVGVERVYDLNRHS